MRRWEIFSRSKCTDTAETARKGNWNTNQSCIFRSMFWTQNLIRCKQKYVLWRSRIVIDHRHMSEWKALTFPSPSVQTWFGHHTKSKYGTSQWKTRGWEKLEGRWRRSFPQCDEQIWNFLFTVWKEFAYKRNNFKAIMDIFCQSIYLSTNQSIVRA